MTQNITMKILSIILTTILITILGQSAYNFAFAFQSPGDKVYTEKDIAYFACYTFNVPNDVINQRLRGTYNFSESACK